MPPDPFALTAERGRQLADGGRAARLVFTITGHMPGMGYNNLFLDDAHGSVVDAERAAFKFLVAWTENTGGWVVSPIKHRGADLVPIVKHAIQFGAAKQGVADALYMLLHE